MWEFINYLLFIIIFKLMNTNSVDEMAIEKPPKVQRDALKELGGNSKSKT